MTAVTAGTPVVLPLRHVARWDLDKTYLRTEFDSFRDLVRTAFERADEKRANPGASALMLELAKAGSKIHILSGSPEQMRKKLEEKLRLDGVQWESFVLKPNLQNVLRLRFRAVRDQLGYKLPALLSALAQETDGAMETVETLFGDDAEADAFVYSLYADVTSGALTLDRLVAICLRGRMYEDVLDAVQRAVGRIKPRALVERILIHLERQSPPADLDVFGPRVVPFYNYFQAALALYEDGRLPPEGLLRVGASMLLRHGFTADRLVRSYAELGRRGHLRGSRVEELAEALPRADAPEALEGLRAFVGELGPAVDAARAAYRGERTSELPDYLALVARHNHRRAK